MKINGLKTRAAGYGYLLNKFGLAGIPHWHTSFVSSSGAYKSKVQDGAIEDIYPIKYWPGEKIGDHLEFALKYDKINLGLLAQIFKKFPQEDLTEYIDNLLEAGGVQIEPEFLDSRGAYRIAIRVLSTELSA